MLNPVEKTVQTPFLRNPSIKMKIGMQLGIRRRLFPHVNSDHPFDRLIEEEEIRAQTYDRLMLDKVKQSMSNKDALLGQNDHLGNPKIQYIKECIQENSLVLPLLDKVRGKTLYLQSYALSKGHCRALATACKIFDSNVINRLYFENCGVDD